jgi:aldehyde:ferredoxin oxidoreductase
MYVSPHKERNPAYIGDTSLESRLFSAVTGLNTTEEDLNRAGERIHNLMRAVMVREMGTGNMRRDHDVLPDHFLENPSPSSGAPPVDRNKFDSLMSMYYKLKGWDKNGLPTRPKLESLDMKDIADSLDSCGLLGKTTA